MRSTDCRDLVLPLWLRLVVLVVLAALTLAVAAQAQSAGVLEGQVVNGTAGGPEVGAGIPVTLHVFQGDVEVDTLESATDPDGRFRFEGLDSGAGLDYWPEVNYLDVPYSPAESHRFEGDQTTLDATITVYETTDDDSTVSLDSVHMIAESFGEVLRISEIHLFGNSGDRTYVGSDGDADQRATVYVPLPEAAVGLALEDGTSGERLVEVDGGVVDTEPVLPGQETSLVFFSYHLMSPGGAIRLERSFAYPVGNMNILVAQPGLTLNSDQLQARGPELFQGRQYEFYATQDLDPDAPLVIELVPVADVSGSEGMPSSPGGSTEGGTGASTRGNQGVLLWIGLALVGLAVIGVVAHSLVSGRSAPAAASAPGLASNPGARPLLADLADLEEAHEAGQIDEATYERQRAEMYEKLKSLQP